MRYRIEIKESYYGIEEYTSDDLTDILDWFRAYYEEDYNEGYITFVIYDNERLLTWEEGYELGFYRGILYE